MRHVHVPKARAARCRRVPRPRGAAPGHVTVAEARGVGPVVHSVVPAPVDAVVSTECAAGQAFSGHVIEHLRPTGDGVDAVAARGSGGVAPERVHRTPSHTASALTRRTSRRGPETAQGLEVWGHARLSDLILERSIAKPTGPSDCHARKHHPGVRGGDGDDDQQSVHGMCPRLTVCKGDHESVSLTK